MATKVESFQSFDGKYFPDELSAVRHEVLIRLADAVPDLKDRWSVIQNNVDAISRALQPLAILLPENHPEAPAENHPEVVVTTLRERCGAVQRSDQMVCAGCNLTWDVNDPVPPACKPPVAVDHGELAGTCDCSAGMNGANDHARSCPSYKAAADA